MPASRRDAAPSTSPASAPDPAAGPQYPCPPLIREKVAQFAEHLETYKTGDYSEAQLRVDYINPMLEALGWDVENHAGYAEAYRDVIYEDAVRIGGSSGRRRRRSMTPTVLIARLTPPIARSINWCTNSTA